MRCPDPIAAHPAAAEPNLMMTGGDAAT